MLGLVVWRRFRELVHDNSASALVVSAFAILALIGGAGLATDTIQWTLWKRQLQRIADSAALSGAYAQASGANGSAAATTEIGRYSIITLSAAPTIETPPTVGPYAGNAMAVRVVVSAARALPFSSMFMTSTPTISAQATGAAVSTGQYCVLALESTTATGVTFWGNSTASMGCGVATNSQGSQAINAGGSSVVSASPLSAVGTIPPSSNYAAGTVLNSNSIVQRDPYGSLPMMSVPSGCNTALSVKPNQSSTVANTTGVQCFNAMNIQGTVTMDPGIYIIDGSLGGQFNIGSQGVVNCTGCVFLLTTSGAASTVATSNVNGGATLNISAPTSGTYAGIMFYQDRNALAGTTNTINGNAGAFLQGAIYFPSQYLQFTGNSNMSANCLQIVARQVQLVGNNKVTNVCPANSGASAFTGTQVRLVN